MAVGVSSYVRAISYCPSEGKHPTPQIFPTKIVCRAKMDKRGMLCSHLSLLGFKPNLQLLLICIFLQFFGLPSIHRFKNDQMMLAMYFVCYTLPDACCLFRFFSSGSRTSGCYLSHQRGTQVV